VAAFTFVNPPPLPLNVPLKVLLALLNETALE